jgi:hypothetical protein
MPLERASLWEEQRGRQTGVRMAIARLIVDTSEQGSIVVTEGINAAESV